MTSSIQQGSRHQFDVGLSAVGSQLNAHNQQSSHFKVFDKKEKESVEHIPMKTNESSPFVTAGRIDSHSFKPKSNYPPTSVTWSTPLTHNLNLSASVFSPHSTFSYQGFDAASRYLALMELKKPPAVPFSGESHQYHSWLRSLHAKLIVLSPSSMNVLDILEAHTIGRPQELVKLYTNTHGADQDEALNLVTRALTKRFGNSHEIASVLRNKLLTFPEIRGHESSPTVARKLRELSDICYLVASQIHYVPDLETLNYGSGIERIRKKLPEFINNKWRSYKYNYIDKFKSHPPFN